MKSKGHIVGGILTAALTASAPAQQGPPPAAVRVDAVRLELVQEQRLVTGELRAVQRSRVAGEEPGLVLAIPVEQGRIVKRGDVLAQLDSRRLEIELQQVEADRQVALADVTEREADLEWRQRDLENYRNLSAGGAGKAKELYDAEMQVRIAEAKLQSMRRGVEAIAGRANLLKRRIADTTITAPFDGVVVSKLVEQGEWLADGAAAVELIATATIDAWLDVPQQYADAIIGATTTPTATINIEASGERIETTSLRVIPLVDPKARTFCLVARLENDKGLLAPGMSITAFVPTGDQADRLTISRDAVMRSATGTMVYVARQTDPKSPPAAMPAEVQVLFGAGERVVVQATSLQAGDLLVVEGNERLFPTAPIIPQPVGPTPDSKAAASRPGETP